PGHIAGSIGEKEDDRTGHVVWLEQPPGAAPGVVRILEGLRLVGPDPARCDGVASHSGGAVELGEVPGEVDYARCRGRVFNRHRHVGSGIQVEVGGGQAVDGRDVDDDSAALVAEGPSETLGDEKGTPEMVAHRVAEVVELDVLDRSTIVPASGIRAV